MSALPHPSGRLPEVPRLTPLPSIFISHSSTDNPFGYELTANLRNMGYDVWYDSYPGRDSSGLVPGDEWFERIQLELTNHPVFLVILSPASMASPWVRDEVSMAWQQKNSATGKVIIPVLYAYTPVLPALATIQFVSFIENCPYENAFAELLNAIRLGKTREREVAQLPLLPVGPPFEEGLLPVPDPFVGREQELTWVLERLRAGGTTSITTVAALHGMGGIGKTALAAKAVQMLRQEGRFPDGVGVLVCQGLHDPVEVLRQILSHFDPQRRLPEEHLDLAGLTSLAHTLLDHQQALIVLDNVEPDWPIEQVVAVLKATGVTLLLTARQTLPQSAVPPTASKAVALLPEEGARALFLSALGRELTSPAETAAVEQILTSVDRHTLAVKLAGAYASTGRDLVTLASVLGTDPLSLPGDESTTQAERLVERVLTQSLATFEAEQEQQLFSCLAAFATPEMGRNAVQDLAEALGVPEPESSLDQLVRRAVLEPSVLSTLPLASDRERVKLHPLLRALAQRRFAELAMDQRTTAQEATAAWYADYANDTEDLALGPDEANILGSLHWARAQSEDELEVVLCLGIRLFWHDTGRAQVALRELPLGIAAAERVAAVSGSREDRRRAVLLALTYGDILKTTGKTDEAEREYLRNLTILQEVQDRHGEGSVLTRIGQVAWQRGHLEQAKTYFQQALAIAREVQNRQGEGTDLSWLGELAKQRGHLEQAEQYYQQSLAIDQEMQDRRGESADLTSLGEVARQRGHLEQAEQYYQQSLAIDQEMQDRQGEGANLSSLGEVARQRGHLEQAEQYYQQGLAIVREVQNRQGEGVVLTNLGQVALQRGQLGQAEAFYQQGLAIDQEVQNRQGEGANLSNLGQVALQRGQLEQAETFFQQSLAIAQETQDRQDEGAVLSNLGQVALQRGQLEQAEQYFHESLAIDQEVQNRQGEGANLSSLGEVARQRGQLEQAEEYYQQSLAIDQEVRDRRGEGIVLAYLGLIAEEREQWEEAEQWYRQGLKVTREVQDAANTASVAQALGQLLIEHLDAKEEGCQLLQEAVRIYEQMGLEEQAEQTCELVADLGCDV